MDPYGHPRPDWIRREPFSATTLIVAGVLAAAGTGTAVYQMEAQKAMQKKALEAQAKMNIAPPPAVKTTSPKPLPQQAGPAPGTTAASMRAQQAATEETERNRKRLNRQATILTSATGAGIGGTLLGA